MARQQYNDGQEIVFDDLNEEQALREQESYDRVVFELIQRAEDAFFDNGFLVSLNSPTAVNVNSGVGFQTETGLDVFEPEKRLLYKSAVTVLNITAPDVVNDRIDIVVVKNRRVDGATESRKFKNASTEVITNENLVTTNDWDADLQIVDGTPAGSPSVPATPAGFIKIAEVLVKAVAGIDNPSNITDTRTLMPIGASSTINSSAFVRLTQSAALTLQQAFAETDAFLKNGTLDDNIFVDSVSDPTAPGVAGEVKLYNKGELLFIRNQAGVITPVGSGAGGGGGGANWGGDALEAVEFEEKVFQFAEGDAAELDLYVKVPQGYLAGRQVQMFLGFYSPSNSDEFKMQAVTTLIRKNQDAIDSTANQETDDTGDFTNTVANQYREGVLDLSTPTGQINGFAVSPGDLLRVELTRIAPGGSDDSADIRFVPSSTEVKFG